MGWLWEIIAMGAILLPVAVVGWFVQRVRDVVADRHPGSFAIIEQLTRPRPNATRWGRQLTRYRLLADPVVDRQIRILRRVEVAMLCGIGAGGVIAFALWGRG